MSALAWTARQLAGNVDLPGRLRRDSDKVSRETLDRMLALMGTRWVSASEVAWMMQIHPSSAKRLLRVARELEEIEMVIGRKPQYRVLPGC